MTAFNSASNLTASLVVAVTQPSLGDDVDDDDETDESFVSSPPRLIHAPHSVTKTNVNFTLKSLPVNAKRVLFVTSRYGFYDLCVALIT